MRTNTFATVFNATSSTQAEQIIDRLRQSGLHPTDLALTTPLPTPAAPIPRFPIEVPSDEIDKANEVLGAPQ